MAGQRNSTLIIPTVQRDDSGRYVCQATIIDGGERASATSRTARVTIRTTTTPRSARSRSARLTPRASSRRRRKYLSGGREEGQAIGGDENDSPTKNE